MFTVCGVDLSGSEKKASGLCFMSNDLEIETFLLKKDSEILNMINKRRPKIVAIDAPLSLPKGRVSLYERSNIHLRECDRALLAMGIKLFPATLGPMRMLTERGMRIKDFLIKEGFEVIEVFPGATQDILGLPRKNQGLKKLLIGLTEIGIKGLKEKMNSDELDAVTCAYTALLYLIGHCIELGSKEEGIIVIPKAFL
ncbi:MAG TPA: DUF429 domain-containing protein [Geobacterales bacterium]|nr:DUF429 domain-containing protein [Geobacterales bacterium]